MRAAARARRRPRRRRHGAGRKFDYARHPPRSVWGSWPGREDLFSSSKKYLFGADNAEPIELHVGSHRYKFACQLPRNIPASLEVAYGSIRYNIKAVLDVPWDVDKEFEIPITVRRKDDLNLEPELKIPINCEESKTFCCLFCKTSPLMMTVIIPYSGFAPGQNIHITIFYNNKSYVEVSNTILTLNRHIKYTSQTPSRKTYVDSSKLVKMCIEEGVYASGSNKFERDLKIPEDLISSNSNYCKTIQVCYELQVEGGDPESNDNLVVRIPITIGSIPLNIDAGDSQEPSAPSESSITIPGETTATVHPTPSGIYIPDSPPPSFDEAIKFPVPIKSTRSLESQPFI